MIPGLVNLTLEEKEKKTGAFEVREEMREGRRFAKGC